MVVIINFAAVRCLLYVHSWNFTYHLPENYIKTAWPLFWYLVLFVFELVRCMTPRRYLPPIHKSTWKQYNMCIIYKTTVKRSLTWRITTCLSTKSIYTHTNARTQTRSPSHTHAHTRDCYSNKSIFCNKVLPEHEL